MKDEDAQSNCRRTAAEEQGRGVYSDVLVAFPSDDARRGSTNDDVLLLGFVVPLLDPIGSAFRRPRKEWPFTDGTESSQSSSLLLVRERLLDGQRPAVLQWWRRKEVIEKRFAMLCGYLPNDEN